PRSGGRPPSPATCGPEVSYSRTGGLSPLSVTSANGTRMSGRDPVTYTLRRTGSMSLLSGCRGRPFEVVHRADAAAEPPSAGAGQRPAHIGLGELHRVEDRGTDRQPGGDRGGERAPGAVRVAGGDAAAPQEPGLP